MIKSLVRPFELFAQEPIIQLLGVYMAYLYGVLYREWSMALNLQHILIYCSIFDDYAIHL